MKDIQFKMDERGQGAFYIMNGNKQIAEMVVAVSGSDLTVYHTEVAEQHEGEGLAKNLLSTMVDYARQHKLQINPLCTYVLAQFRRHSKEYSDVWKKEKV